MEEGLLTGLVGNGGTAATLARGQYWGLAGGVVALLLGLWVVGVSAPAAAQEEALFQEPARYPANSFSSGDPLEVADFNEDGRDDIALSEDDETVVIRLNDGDGTFSSSPSATLDPEEDDIWNLTSGDFDEDGHLDLVTANALSDTVSIFLGDGSGGFALQSTISLPDETDFPRGLTTGNFNDEEDDHLDVVVGTRGQNNLVLLPGNGNGTFDEPESFADFTVQEVVAGDVNDDGHLDLVTRESPVFSVYFGDGNGDFTFDAFYRTEVEGDEDGGGGPKGLKLADFDDDGDLDVATVSQINQAAYLFFNDGSGGFDERTKHPVVDADSDMQPKWTAVEDFDGDGRADVAAPISTSDEPPDAPAGLAVLFGQEGDDKLAPPEHVMTGLKGSPLVAGDFDGGGGPDLVHPFFTSSASGDLAVFLNTREAAGLSLSPQDATNLVGETHTVTATVTGDEDQPLEGVRVEFAVSGAHEGTSGSVSTDSAGEASFAYTGENVGDDTITAFADNDGDGEADDGEPSGTAAKTWHAPPSVSVKASAQGAEPDTDGEFTFTRSGSTAESVTVTYDVSGSATAGADYVELDGEVTFAAGSETAAEPVEVIDDDEVEDDETVTATIQDGEAYDLGEPAEATVTITDDDTADDGEGDGDGTGDGDGDGTGDGDGDGTGDGDGDGDGAGDAEDDGAVDDGTAAAGTQVAGSDGPTAACGESFVPAAGFGDVAGSVHASAIDCVAWYAITLGVGDVDGDGQSDYAPSRPVTRDQMASFLARLADEAGLQAADAPDAFGDDDGSVHEDNINTLAALGVTQGKGDLDGDGQAEYAPREPVTRDQMASFLARLADQAGLDVPGDAPDAFGDDDGSVHEGNINALAALGISQGKGDVDGDGEDEYAPREPVNRAQMASFIARELGQLVDAGLAEPGGADVSLQDASQGGELAGSVDSHKSVTGVTADGCGLSGQAVEVGADGGFTVAIPDDQSAGDCQLTVTVTTQRPGVDAGGQTVPYTFDVTVSG